MQCFSAELVLSFFLPYFLWMTVEWCGLLFSNWKIRNYYTIFYITERFIASYKYLEKVFHLAKRHTLRIIEFIFFSLVDISKLHWPSVVTAIENTVRMIWWCYFLTSILLSLNWFRLMLGGTSALSPKPSRKKISVFQENHFILLYLRFPYLL